MADLPHVSTRDPDFTRYWTVSEAITILCLQEAVTPRQLRAAIRRAGIAPAGRRHSASFRGTLAQVYPAEDLIRLAARHSA